MLRLFDTFIDMLDLPSLGFSDVHRISLEKALALHSGLVAIVGPTGSGKTTTLYSMLRHVQDSSRLIVTIEDPVERHLSGIRQIEVGGTTLLDYPTVLRSVMRQDPDIIMIGEIRDKDSAQLAAQAALTGHLVITTLHASSVSEAKSRLFEMGVSPYLIESTLRCVVAQRLVSKICESCKVEDKDNAYQGWFIESEVSMAKMVLQKGKGCKKCNFKGISGRVVISETMDEKNSLYVDAYQKAAEGIIPFSEVVNLGVHYKYG